MPQNKGISGNLAFTKSETKEANFKSDLFGILEIPHFGKSDRQRPVLYQSVRNRV